MLAGTFSAVVASRLFQARTESRPSIGGIFAPDPVATTTARVATSSSPPTAIRPSPTKRPSPRKRSISRSSSQGSWPESSSLWIAASRRARTAAGSSSASVVDRHARGSASPRPARRRGAAAPSRACTRSRSIRRRSGLSRRSRPSSPLPPASRPPPRPPARRRARSRRRSSRSRGRTITDVSHGGDRLRRGRFVRDGCRSRLSEASLNPDTNQYVRTMSSPLPLSS